MYTITQAFAESRPSTATRCRIAEVRFSETQKGFPILYNRFQGRDVRAFFMTLVPVGERKRLMDIDE